MSVSGIGSSSGFDFSKVVKNLDSNGDGSVDKQEFVTGAKARGVSEEDGSKQFDKIDTKKTGKITQSDLEADVKAQAATGKKPPPSGGRPAGAQAAGSTSQTNASSTNSNYDKKDANKDGTVTAQEEILYNLKHPVEVTTKKTASQVGENVDVNA